MAVRLQSHTCLTSHRYFSERGDAVAKASKDTHVVSAQSTGPSVDAAGGGVGGEIEVCGGEGLVLLLCGKYYSKKQK